MLASCQKHNVSLVQACIQCICPATISLNPMMVKPGSTETPVGNTELSDKNRLGMRRTRWLESVAPAVSATAL